jgi:toxin YoeB
MAEVDNVSFTLDGFKDYIYLQAQDKKALAKVNKLIADIIRNGNTGIGHPEPLRHDLSGKWSRTIDDKNRLTYKIHDGGRVEIFNCRGHYDEK